MIIFICPAVYLRGDDLISQSIVGNISTYHADGQGSIKALSSQAGTPTDQFIYTAYGELEHRKGMTDSDFLYTGEQFDAGLGFYYLRARYYNPSNGRFPTMETYQGRVGEAQTLHKYLYVHADPVNNIDPSGNVSLASVGTLINVSTTLRLTAVSTVRESWQQTIRYGAVRKVRCESALLDSRRFIRMPNRLHMPQGYRR